MFICEKCEKKFKELATKTEPAEYAGGKAWSFQVSPCCGDSYYEEVA